MTVAFSQGVSRWCFSQASQALDEGSIPFTRSNVFNDLDFSSFPVRKKYEKTDANSHGHGRIWADGVPQ